MKKLIAFIIVIALSTTIFTVSAFADKGGIPNQGNRPSFNMNDSPVITYGRIKLPLAPIEKGMGASVNYTGGKILITRDTTVIEIDLTTSKVFITKNGIRTEDTKSGIFTPKNNRKMTVLIKYIAEKLGIKVHTKGDDVIIVNPLLHVPSNITVTPMGGKVVNNTLNSTNLYLNVQANITAGQATGGKAELYIGSKLIATDSQILVTDTTVNFTTSDVTPTALVLQALIPNGGKVSIKLYNSSGESVTGNLNTPLIVDYSSPVITGLNSAIYYPAQKRIDLYVSGTYQKGDILDITKVYVSDISAGINRILLDAATTGIAKTGSVISINLGSSDVTALAGIGGTDMTLMLLSGEILSDTAGNPPAKLQSALSIPLTIIK